MSECINRQRDIVSSMTGSTRAGSLKARDEEPLAQPVSPAHGDKRRMTPVPLKPDQPIQLTPLWEHVVRTQKFPPDVDPVSTFAEISMRLRDPEWEVRQHALRVLIDVLPTLNADYVDEIVKPVIAELINNLGHLAPSVRKGALDALRSYLQCCRARDDIVTDILNGLDRRNEPFHANINLGVILSTPSLLFPSSRSADPSKRSVKMVVTALTKRLAEVMYQEAAVRSLVKIRDTIGSEAFDSYFEECSASVRRDFDVLCAAYKLSEKPVRVRRMRKSSGKKSQSAREDVENENRVDEDKTSVIPLSRVVLETEIKFNEQTAITMTILEQKETSEVESAEEQEVQSQRKTSEPRDAWIEQRKTPRRVHFGGEIVKLRTPDSEDSETIEAELPQTRIPLPISPVTKMPVFRPGRSRSNPCSPNSPRWRVPRRARSASNGPKREFYVHDGSLSPKKGILSKNSLLVDKYVRETFKTREDDVLGLKESDRSWSFEVFDDVNDEILAKEKNLFVEKTRKKKKFKKSVRVSERERVKVQVEDSNKLEHSSEIKINEICFKEDAEFKVESENSAANEENLVEKLVSESVMTRIKMEEEEEEDSVDEKNIEIKGLNVESGKSLKKSADKTRSSPRKPVFESFPRQERNYIFMELSSPVKRNSQSREVSPGSIQSTEHSQEPKAASSNPLLCELNDQTTLNTELSIDERVPFKDSSTPTTADKLVENKIDEKAKNFVNSTTKNPENSEEITGSSSDGDGKISEPSWEELGLVDQEVLNDLHNKDDWRARVRGLERIASALRTSSALVAIEPRLGSLLHAVLGCERSCRVAAAGMAVARVLVAGVSEEALRRRLPQIAWGLARQGGPNAAQLARVAMLRLRPALLLEQLLQPHCIGARNAKTRENALQLLIFSLVTFPSTEFKVENVANKVALMVGDRRRRVRQAALDTLAVLAQIYEPEEVLQAGQRAAKQLREGSEMVAAIRARLARKSLPMVSADGLVVYGLQISPTIQIATGSDVDWIVAGSGSVSPGTGRARGQIISMNGKMGLEKNTNSKIDEKKNALERNIVAVGVGLLPKSENPVAWQLLPPSRKNENNSVDEVKYQKNSSLTSSNKNARHDDRRLFNSFDTLETSCDTDDVSSSLQNDKDVIMKQRKTEENFHRRMDEIYSGTSQRSVRLESRIPVRQYRESSVVRHSTAYQRRQAAEKIYPTPVSAPYITAGPHAVEIQRRYRGDRVKRPSRLDDRSPARDSFLPSYRSYTRKSIVQTRVLVAQEPVNACRIDSRALRDATAQNTFSNIQEFNSRVRSSSSSSLTHNGDKSNYGENDCEEKNRRNASAQTNNAFRGQEVTDPTSLGRDRETYEASSESSADRDDLIVPDFSDDHISPAKSFDVITRDSNPSRRSSIEQVAVNVLSSTTTDSTDLEKETSSDDVASSREIDSDDLLVADQASGSSVMSNDLNSADDGDRDGITSRTSSAIKAIAFDHVDGSPLNVSLAFDRDSSIEPEADSELRDQASIYPVPTAFFQPPDVRQAQKDEQQQTEEEDDEDEEVEKSEAVNSMSIVVASRPHSRVASEYREVAFQPLDIRQPPGDGETSASGSVIHHSSPLRSTDHKDISVVDEIVSAPEILHELPIEPEVHPDMQQPSSIAADDEILADTVAGAETPKKFPSRVPRSRVNVRGLNKIGPAAGYYEKTVGRSKPITPQCFAQLESNDWEVTVKGLKALSALARQHPEQLDNCPAGIIGRLLGRHVRNLRSQVSRTACIAAGDVFETEARCIDQELDDIAGPLLHRTADTNKFLRADSNAALDRMIEHLPAHRTILVIVQRGASHQNAIVRATTARLLCSIVEDHIGPDLAMNLPRDVREKLLATGAKLLMDGNLDARNYAKTMFRRLSKCEGFRKALTDCVPETTLRHIDKTLRSL